MATSVLVIDDDAPILKMLQVALARKHYRVFAAPDISSGMKALQENEIDIIFCDLRIGDETGIDFLRFVKSFDDEIPVVIMTGYPDIDSVAESLRLNAFDFIHKPIEPSVIFRVIVKGLEYRSLKKKKRELEIQLEEHNRHLEKLVKEKTEELRKTNETLRKEIEIRKRAEESLRETNKQLEREIVERKQMEEALSISEERLHMAMEASDEGLWDYNLETGSMYLSPRWFTMLGYEPDELPSTMKTLFNLLHPDDREQMETLESRLEKVDIFSSEYRMKSKAGEWLYLTAFGKVFSRHETGEPVRVVGTQIDVTEKKHSERALMRAHSELDQIFNSTSDGMCLVDMASYILKINQAMLDFFDWEEDSVLGKPFCQLLPPYKYYSTWSSTDSDVNRVEHDLTVSITNEDTRYIILTASPFKGSDGKLRGFLYNIRDITKRVKVEREMEKNRELILGADKMKTLGVLVSGVAHEVNNPNNFIMLNTSILRQVWKDLRPLLDVRFEKDGDFLLANLPYSQMKTHIPEVLEGLMEGSERIRKLISDLKDYARGNTREMSETVDINLVVEKSVSLLKNMIRKSDAVFSMHLSQNLPAVRGDFNRIEQVFINLIENACQALTEWEREIQIKTYHEPARNRTVFCIRDTGVGISVENLRKILDPFFSTRKDQGGTGLGLSVCNGIVREHGGEMSFDSEPGKGTEVTVSFPSISGQE